MEVDIVTFKLGDPMKMWPWYVGLVGVSFESRPVIQHVIQQSLIRVGAHAHDIVEHTTISCPTGNCLSYFGVLSSLELTNH